MSDLFADFMRGWQFVDYVNDRERRQAQEDIAWNRQDELWRQQQDQYAQAQRLDRLEKLGRQYEAIALNPDGTYKSVEQIAAEGNGKQLYEMWNDPAFDAVRNVNGRDVKIVGGRGRGNQLILEAEHRDPKTGDVISRGPLTVNRYGPNEDPEGKDPVRPLTLDGIHQAMVQTFRGELDSFHKRYGAGQAAQYDRGLINKAIGFSQPQAPGAAPQDNLRFANAPQGMSENYLPRVHQIESAGGTKLTGANSSAKGHFQWTNGTARQYGLLGDGFDNRGDLEKEKAAFEHFTSDNAKQLEAAGVPVNDTTLYLAHQQGAGGAIEILRAAAEGREVSPEIRRNMDNNGGQGLTPAQFVTKWDDKMGGYAGQQVAAAQESAPAQGQPMPFEQKPVAGPHAAVAPVAQGGQPPIDAFSYENNPVTQQAVKQYAELLAQQQQGYGTGGGGLRAKKLDEDLAAARSALKYNGVDPRLVEGNLQDAIAAPGKVLEHGMSMRAAPGAKEQAIAARRVEAPQAAPAAIPPKGALTQPAAPGAQPAAFSPQPKAQLTATQQKEQRAVLTEMVQRKIISLKEAQEIARTGGLGGSKLKFVADGYGGVVVFDENTGQQVAYHENPTVQALKTAGRSGRGGSGGSGGNSSSGIKYGKDRIDALSKSFHPHWARIGEGGKHEPAAVEEDLWRTIGVNRDALAQLGFPDDPADWAPRQWDAYLEWYRESRKHDGVKSTLADWIPFVDSKQVTDSRGQLTQTPVRGAGPQDAVYRAADGNQYDLQAIVAAGHARSLEEAAALVEQALNGA